MTSMARTIGYFVLLFAAIQLLRYVPFIGGLFNGLLGFYLAAAVLSLGIAWVSSRLVARRRFSRRVRDLGHVESAHNQGKLGSLLLAHGRAREALPPLDRAANGEPGVAEWHYRLGLARLAVRDASAARAALQRAFEIAPEHAYGALQLSLAQACAKSGDSSAAMAALDRYERDYGRSAESAFRRGQVLAALGRKAEARASYAEVQRLTSQGERFERRNRKLWALRAFFARLV
jgi:tetratricopeptide (TPR) repeat protein